MLFSNRSIVLIAALLFAGILLDGKAYNRSPEATGIYRIKAFPKIRVSKDEQTIMQFEHRDGRWHLTEPFVAPVHASRVQPLLDTNQQGIRSYNKNEVDTHGLFDDNVVLEIDAFKYQLGQMESVSQMRYVMANNKVYLQADQVIPLLHAGQKAFVDLAVTNQVTAIKINGQDVADPTLWSNLGALGLITPEQITGEAAATIAIATKHSRQRNYTLHSIGGIAALVVENGDYGYLLGTQQAESLGLAEYL